MNYKVFYHELVVKEDLPKLGQRIKLQIKKAIETRLMASPEIFGKPLRRSLRGYRKLRAGDYCVIFSIQGNKVKIFIIGHRSMVYEKIRARL